MHRVPHLNGVWPSFPKTVVALASCLTKGSTGILHLPPCRYRTNSWKPVLGGLFQWRSDSAMTELANEYIKLLEIKCTGPRQRAGNLSGGNQQKVCLAKAFALRPEILFVSEPTRGIDIGAKHLVLETLKKYNREYGTTIVVVSSELEELRSVCDRVAIVYEGCIEGVLPHTAPLEDFGILMAVADKDELLATLGEGQ